MKFCGKDFLLQLYIDGEWVTLNGQRSTGAAFNEEQVDVTEKGAMPWRKLRRCGVRSVTLTASGFVSDVLGPEQFNWLKTRASAGSAFVEARILRATVSEYQGEYLLATYEETGEYNGAAEYSITLESTAEPIKGVAPVLDPFPVTARSCGYAVFRLVSSYTGPCVRVRRASDNAELNVQFNSAGVLDWETVEAWNQGSTTTIVRWYNQLGSFPNLGQTVSDDQPLLTDESGKVLFVNGLPYALATFDKWLEFTQANPDPVDGVVWFDVVRHASGGFATGETLYSGFSSTMQANVVSNDSTGFREYFIDTGPTNRFTKECTIDVTHYGSTRAKENITDSFWWDEEPVDVRSRGAFNYNASTFEFGARRSRMALQLHIQMWDVANNLWPDVEVLTFHNYLQSIFGV